MHTQYSFVARDSRPAMKTDPVEMTPALVVISGIGAMIAVTLAFILGN